MPLALPRESWLLPLGERSLAAAPSGPWLAMALEHEAATTLVFEGPLGNPRASGPLTQHNAQQARSTLFTLLFFSSPGLEPNPARLEPSVHSSLDLKHFTAGEH